MISTNHNDSAKYDKNSDSLSLKSKDNEIPFIDPNSKTENSLYLQINSKFQNKIRLVYLKPRRMKIYVEPKNILEIANFLKTNIGFDHAESVS
jgi:hypothetical protein